MNHSSSIVFGPVSLVCCLQFVIFCLESVVCGLPMAPLHLSRILYKSALFMQNKPNFRKAKMNLNIYNTMDYENISDWTIGQNKPNSNPNKACPACPEFIEGSAPVLSKVEGIEWANFRKAKMNVKSVAYIYLRSIMSLIGRS